MARKMDDVVEELREAATKALGDVGQSLKRNADDVADGIRKHADARRDLDSDMARSGSDRPGGNTRDSTTTDGSSRDGDRDQQGCGDPVDVATGAVFLQQTDLSLPGDIPLVLTRKHSSDWTYGHWFGVSWSSSFDQRIDVHTDLVGRRSAVVVAADARAHVFKNLKAGEEARPVAGGPLRLQAGDDGGYRLLDTATGETRHYGTVVGGTVWLSSITNPSGDWIRFTRDEHGAPAEVTHSAGYRVQVATTGDRVTGLAVTRPDGADPTEVMSYRYDSHGDLAGVVNGSGQELQFTYDQHRMSRWIDRNGTIYDYAYDDRGRCVSQGGSDGVMRNTFDYGEPNASGLRETRVTDSRELTTAFKINSRFQVVASIDPLGATTTSEWSEQNQLLARTDPFGRRTTFVYDAAGNLTEVTRPDGSQVTMEWVYTPAGPRLAGQVLPDGSATTLAYDEAGRRISATDAAGDTTEFGYGADGHLASVTDALGRVRTIETDAAGLPRRVVEPDGRWAEFERDHFGRVIASTDALGARTAYSWTVDGQLGARVLPDGATETWTYDAEGNPVSYIDPAGRVTHTRFTHFDMPAEVIAPDGSTTQYAYDPELRLTSVTSPQGAVWRYDYDEAGRLATETDYNGRTLAYVYDTAGQLVEQTNGAGQRLVYDYDTLGNVVSERAGDQTTTMTYDPLGRLLRATSSDVDLVIERDPLGRVLAESVNGHSVVKAYDALGRPTRRTTPAGVETTWGYGAGLAPERMTVAGREIAFEHDLSGRETRRATGDVVLEQTWDILGQPLTQRLERSADAVSAPGDVLQERTYAYESAGRLIGVEDRLTGARRFELDIADRITSVELDGSTSEAYSYDPLGNITRSATACGDAERRDYEGTLLTRSGRSRYAYDAQGRLVRHTRTRLSEKPDTWLYEWDANDRLTAVRTPDGTRWTYLYDALGRRVAKRRHAEDGSVAEEVLFAWDGPVLIEQSGGSGDTISWAYQGYQPLGQVELSQDEVEARFYSIVTDLAGAPSELVESDGNIVWHARRTIWGSASEDSGTPLRFAGQYADSESGLYYNHHRYYDPSTGRYLSQDPLGLAPAPNPNTYVHNPTNWVDPAGLQSCPKDGQIFLWRAVQADELRDILSTRQWSSPQGVKYFAFSERGAADYARTAYSRWPDEGAYTMTRTSVKVSDLPADAQMAYTADVKGGGYALNNDELKLLGRPSVMPGGIPGAGA